MSPVAAVVAKTQIIIMKVREQDHLFHSPVFQGRGILCANVDAPIFTGKSRGNVQSVRIRTLWRPCLFITIGPAVWRGKVGEGDGENFTIFGPTFRARNQNAAGIYRSSDDRASRWLLQYFDNMDLDRTVLKKRGGRMYWNEWVLK